MVAYFPSRTHAEPTAGRLVAEHARRLATIEKNDDRRRD
jgi:hypothetical protein